MKNEPLVSVIIPTYNSEGTLAKCLKSIKNQTHKNIEVIVVDNFSTDKTRDIANNYGAKVLQLKSERARAKNFGMERARGDYVCFVDSDMELTPRVVEECLELITSNDNVGGVIIPERSVGKSFWVKIRDFERSFYINTEIESARFFRKDLCKKVNGFDENIMLFEESTLPQKIEKLGYNVKVIAKSLILHHEDDFSLWKWLKKKYYYAKTVHKYRKEYGEYASKQLSLLYRFGLFFKSKRFYDKPLLAFGILILKLLEYFSASLGFLVGMRGAKSEKLVNYIEYRARNKGSREGVQRAYLQG